MALFKPKQIKKLLAGYINLDGFSLVVSDGLTVEEAEVTTVLATAVTTAGSEGVAVPNQEFFDENGKRQEGWILFGANLVSVYDENRKKIKDSENNEVYGRLTRTGPTPEEIQEKAAYDALIVQKDDAILNGYSRNDYRTMLNNNVNLYDAAHPTPRTSEEQAYMDVLTEAQSAGAMFALTANAAIANVLAQIAQYSTLPGLAYFVKFYSRISNVETPFEFFGETGGSTYVFDFILPYLFTFEHLPAYFATNVKSNYIGDDPVKMGDQVFEEELTYLGINDFSKLTYVPLSGSIILVSVNGVQFSNVDSNFFGIDPVTNKMVWVDDDTYSIDEEDTIVVNYKHSGVLAP